MEEQIHSDDLAALDARINALLPARYQGNYVQVSPVSMGSAGLKFGADGKVAWNEIWTSFCDLALAGGPPHRGVLLGPVSVEEATADVEQYVAVSQEIARAFRLVTGLPVVMEVGWVGVVCETEGMAAWLTMAIVAENVSAVRRGVKVLLPAGPAFRLEKEVKNVVVALAKTCHYWSGHRSAETGLDLREVIVAPVGGGSGDGVGEAIAAAIGAGTGWSCDAGRYVGWVGVSCPDEDAAVWLMRAIIVGGVLARREGQSVYIAAGSGEETGRIIAVWERAWGLWKFSRAV